jgi:hypothetical protein
MPSKPKWKHHRTYYKARKQLDKLEAPIKAAAEQAPHATHGRSDQAVLGHGDRTFLHQRPAFIPSDAEVFISHDAEVTVAAPQSRWARFFLTERALSLRKAHFQRVVLFVLRSGNACAAAGMDRCVFRRCR